MEEFRNNENIEKSESVNTVSNENQTRVKSKKPIIIAIITIFAVVLIGASLWYFVFRSKDVVIPNLAITASDMDNYETLLTTKFNIKSDVPTDKEYLTKTLTIEPALEYEITQIDELDYQIIPKAELKSNTLYNVTYSNEDTKYKWSFQTENVYKLSTMYPSDESSNISIKTVIEMNFSYIPKDNISDYVEITPKTVGEFHISDRRVKFIPANHLEYGTKYEITIKKGFGNKENTDVLQEDMNYTFYTQVIDYSKRIFYFENLFSFRTDETIKIASSYQYSDIEVLPGKIMIYQYDKESEFLSALQKQKGFGDYYNSLIEIDTSKMVKIYENASDNAITFEENRATIKTNEKLSQGYYLAVININENQYYINMQVNDLMAYYSTFDDKQVAWVLSANNENAIEGADVYVNDLPIGVTNAQGYVLADKNNDKTKIVKIRYSDYPNLYLSLDDSEGDYGEIGSYYNETQTLNSYTFVDRSAYKTGQTAHIWGYVKNRGNEKIDNVTVEIFESGYWEEAIKTIPLKVDEYGCYKTDVDLSNFDNSYYEVTVTSNGKSISYSGFEVLQYNLNAYDISLSTDKEVVFSGEKVQFKIVAKLYDGTPVSNEEFDYRYGSYNNYEKGKIKTDINGIAIVTIDTTYLTPYTQPLYKSFSIQGADIEINEYNTYAYIVVLPKTESYDITGEYDKETDSYIFSAKTYMYNKDDDNYVGTATSRKVNVKVHKYERYKVLLRTYYDENTKTMQDVYTTKSRYLGEDIIQIDTISGAGKAIYLNPLREYEDAYIRFGSEMELEDGTIVMEDEYENYVSTTESYSSTESNYLLNYNVDYQKKYKVNEKIPLNLTKNESNIVNPCKIMYLIKSAKGIEVKITNNSQDSIIFSKEYGANVVVKGCVYEGGNLSLVGYSEYDTEYFGLDQSEMEIDLGVKFDKVAYRPGEKATITINTKYKGNPVEAEVNICAIDKAFADVYGESYGIIDSLYNNYYFENYKAIMSHTKGKEYMGGGCGGGDGERSNFATTAIFETIKTDENGNATLEITWPDNITSWNVLSQCVSKNFEAGSSEQSISVTLPYFVSPIYKEQYLAGEAPDISIRSDGTAIKNGDKVEYTVELTAPDGQKLTQKIESKVGPYAKYTMPELKEGTYKLKVSGRCGDYTDTVIHDIYVNQTLLKTKQIEEYTLEKGQDISLVGNIGKMYLVNTSAENILNELFELSSLPKLRNDQIVVSSVANGILKELSNDQYSYTENVKQFSYGINIIESADSDLDLTARIISTGYKGIIKTSMSEYLERIIYNEESEYSSRDKLFAYWGLAALKQPVLTSLKQANATYTSTDVFEKILIALGFADIGDYDSANQCFDEIKAQLTVDNKEVYGYATMLAMKLNREERKAMYDTYLNLNTETEYSNFVKLAYVQNEVIKNVEKASITLEINGEKEVIDLKEVGVTIKVFEKTDKVKVIKMTKNIKAKLEQYKGVDKSNSKYLLNREYLIDDKQVTTFDMGDTVTNRIYIDYDKIGADNRYLCVEEVIPNCMVYLPQNGWYGYEQNVIGYPSSIDGQKITFSIYKTEENVPYIEYQTRVVGSGSYLSDGAVLKAYNNAILDYSSFGNIIVK